MPENKTLIVYETKELFVKMENNTRKNCKKFSFSGSMKESEEIIEMDSIRINVR